MQGGDRTGDLLIPDYRTITEARHFASHRGDKQSHYLQWLAGNLEPLSGFEPATC